MTLAGGQEIGYNGIMDANATLAADSIKDALSPLFRSYGVKKAVLFGSYAKGCATAKSDVDLFVESGLRGLRFVGLIEDLRSALGGRPVDLFDVTHVEKGSRMYNEILRTGIKIYG